MMRSRCPARILFAALLLLPLKTPTSAGPPSKTPAARYSIPYSFPRLAPGQIWVSSVPAGLDVHLGDTPTPQKVHGHTPLVLNIRDVDRYVTVTIHPEEFGGELPNVMAFLDFTSWKTHSTFWRDQNAEGKTVDKDWSRAISYYIRPDKPTIIAIFQTKEQTPADLDRLYPPGSNFRFSDQALRSRLAQKGVPPDFISSGIRLLHRGGKIALPGTKGWMGWVIAEVTPSGQVELLDRPSNPAK
jgi:hypothetical protein